MSNADWAVTCAAFALVFLVFGVVFALLKGKATVLLSGFNALSKQERAQYDCDAIARDHRNMFLLWAAVFLPGAGLSYFIGAYAAVAAMAVWLLLMSRQIHFSFEKAYGKYRLNNDRKD